MRRVVASRPAQAGRGAQAVFGRRTSRKERRREASAMTKCGRRGANIDDFPSMKAKRDARRPLHHATRGPPPPRYAWSPSPACAGADEDKLSRSRGALSRRSVCGSRFSKNTDRHCEERKPRSNPERSGCTGLLSPRSALSRNDERKEGCGTPTDAGHCCPHANGVRHAPRKRRLAPPSACGRAHLSAFHRGSCQGEYLIPKARPGPGFVGPCPRGGGPRRHRPTSSDAPRTPVLVPAGLMPEPPGNGVQIRPRAPSSLRWPGMPPGHVLHVSEDRDVTGMVTDVKWSSLKKKRTWPEWSAAKSRTVGWAEGRSAVPTSTAENKLSRLADVCPLSADWEDGLLEPSPICRL